MREYRALVSTGPVRLVDTLNRESAVGHPDFQIEKITELRNGDLMALVSWESEDPAHIHD